MISKITFCGILKQVEAQHKFLKAMESAVGQYLGDGILIQNMIDLIYVAVNGCFSDEEIEKYVYNSFRSGECEDLEWNYETIDELVQSFCWDANFGKNEEYVEDRLVIRDSNDNIVERYAVHNAEELYNVICRFLARINDEDTNLNYYIRCTSNKLSS